MDDRSRAKRAVLGDQFRQLRAGWKRMNGEAKAMVIAYASIVIVVLPMLGYREVFDGREDPYYISSRLLEQVHDNTCAEESGYDVDEASWTAACDALVADVVPGTQLSAVQVRQFNNSTSEEVIVTSSYQSVDGVSAGLSLSFELNSSRFPTRAALTGIRSTSSARVGSVYLGSYERSERGERDEPAGRALIKRVQALLAEGRCAEIEALAPPKGAFPATSPFDGCDSVVTLASLGDANSIPPSEAWQSSVYAPSELVLPETSEVYGIRRRDGEEQWDYAFRVVDAVQDTNRQLELETTNPDITISAILYEGKWYLGSVLVRATKVFYP